VIVNCSLRALSEFDCLRDVIVLNVSISLTNQRSRESQHYTSDVCLRGTKGLTIFFQSGKLIPQTLWSWNKDHYLRKSTPLVKACSLHETDPYKAIISALLTHSKGIFLQGLLIRCHGIIVYFNSINTKKKLIFPIFPNMHSYDNLYPWNPVRKGLSMFLYEFRLSLEPDVYTR
jgi:hypothetical protein